MSLSSRWECDHWRINCLVQVVHYNRWLTEHCAARTWNEICSVMLHLYDRVFFTNWLRDYILTSNAPFIMIFTIHSIFKNNGISSRRMLVITKNPISYFMPFSCSQEALKVFSSPKYLKLEVPLSLHKLIDAGIVSPGLQCISVSKLGSQGEG